MEHQAVVPVPVHELRAVLRDPARAARCVPGLQRDADAAADPFTGRLRLRLGKHTITYRGGADLDEDEDGAFVFAGKAGEVRGSGTVVFHVKLRLEPTADGSGTRITVTAGGTAEGRAAELPAETLDTATRRLLDRTVGGLAAEAGRAPTAEHTGTDAAADAAAEADAEVEAADAGPGSGAEPGTAGGTVPPGRKGSPPEPSVFDTEVPPPSLDPFPEEEFSDLTGIEAPRPPAEAAHARRTMIGRSAEEVDHAPPRGRYAPVPAPGSVNPGVDLRRLAPAAAVALAGAVVLARALRRRR
ncbi:SRPBCC domain-containing protein [Streptomyces sp. BI20]|uniref:SRPBCC domain-containing protein n=1 Tax=Streptomyces sp. BI20 TaxID=3403460 RepID=UPI003C7422FC